MLAADDTTTPATDGLNLESFSFSYRWLVNITDVDSSYSSSATAASFIDIDPRMMSLRWSGEVFDFGNGSNIADTLAHADEIFSGGVLLPYRLPAAEKDDCGRLLSPDSVLSRSASLDSTRVLLSLSRRYDLLRPTSASSTETSWPESSASRKLLSKYLRFLMPLLKKVKLMRRTSASATEEGRSGSGSRRRKRRRRKAGLDRCRRASSATVAAIVDEGMERSIQEAVLHCKKSNGIN